MKRVKSKPKAKKTAPRKRADKAQRAFVEQAKQLLLPGLEEVPAHLGSAHTTLRVKGGKVPTTEQRVFMAKRVQERKNIGAYVPQAARQAAAPPPPPQPVPQPQSEVTEMKKTTGIPGLKLQDIVKEHAANAKEFAAAEAAKLKAAAAKAKEDEKAAEKARKAAKVRKGTDVTPKVTPKFAAPEAAKGKGKTNSAPPPAVAAAPRGRPRKGYPEGTKFHVLKDPTKAGMSKVFLTTAIKLKKFTKAELVKATKQALQNEDRAGKFFDYFVAKQAFAPVK